MEQALEKELYETPAAVFTLFPARDIMVTSNDDFEDDPFPETF